MTNVEARREKENIQYRLTNVEGKTDIRTEERGLRTELKKI